MRKLVMVFLVIAVIADGWALWYLIRRQGLVEERLKEAVSKEIEERSSIEQGIKQEFESKRQARDFLSRREYEKQLEDFSFQLDEYKAQLQEAKDALGEQLKALEQNSNQLSDYAKKLQSDFDVSVKELESRLNGKSKELEARLNDKFQEQKESLKLLEDSLASSIKELQVTDRMAKEYIKKLKSSLEARISSLEDSVKSGPEKAAGSTF